MYLCSVKINIMNYHKPSPYLRASFILDDLHLRVAYRSFVSPCRLFTILFVSTSHVCVYEFTDEDSGTISNLTFLSFVHLIEPHLPLQIAHDVSPFPSWFVSLIKSMYYDE